MGSVRWKKFAVIALVMMWLIDLNSADGMAAKRHKMHKSKGFDQSRNGISFHPLGDKWASLALDTNPAVG